MIGHPPVEAAAELVLDRFDLVVPRGRDAICVCDECRADRAEARVLGTARLVAWVALAVGALLARLACDRPTSAIGVAEIAIAVPLFASAILILLLAKPSR